MKIDKLKKKIIFDYLKYKVRFSKIIIIIYFMF